MAYLPQLPDELVEEIFKRMPTNAITRCKLLSKAWKEKIKDWEFIKKHFRQMCLQNRVRTLLQPENSFIPLQYLSNNGGQRLNRRVINQSLRDFEYVANCRSLALVVDNNDETYLLNPTTNDKYPVPEEEIGFPPQLKSASVLYGVGWISDQEDYQVVRLALFHHMDSLSELKVYSRKTHQWRNCGEFPYNRLVTTPGVHANSCVHWMLYTEHIVAFDLANDSYRLINLPFEVNRDYRHHSFCALNDEKLVVLPSFYIQDESLDLWILEVYTDDRSWIKHTVELDFPIRNVFRVISFQPLFIMEPNRDKIVIRINPLGTFWCWDLKALRFLPMPGQPIVNVSSSAFPCVEALS